jgi:hypothetical protein
MTKSEFINHLTDYLLSEVKALQGKSKNEQYSFLREVMRSVKSDKLNKIYRRRWFRDLPDPNDYPDLVDSMLILNRIQWVNHLNWFEKIINPIMSIEASFAGDNKYDMDFEFVFPDRIVTYWLCEYVKKYHENFNR